mmetsp:Transcript_26724/g.42845  ORF Transcript_26724/g.42845 Transcript_26724/m.42845 type:complete len:124 (-) Transcript_26724:376-747(-)
MRVSFFGILSYLRRKSRERRESRRLSRQASRQAKWMQEQRSYENDMLVNMGTALHGDEFHTKSAGRSNRASAPARATRRKGDSSRRAASRRVSENFVRTVTYNDYISHQQQQEDDPYRGARIF